MNKFPELWTELIANKADQESIRPNQQAYTTNFCHRKRAKSIDTLE